MDLRGATTLYLIRPRFRANQRNRAASPNRMTRPMRFVGMRASSAAQRKMVRWSTWSMSATFSGVRYTGSAGRGSIPSAGAAIEVLLVEASVAVVLGPVPPQARGLDVVPRQGVQEEPAVVGRGHLTWYLCIGF